MNDRKTNRTQAAKVKADDIMAFTYYGKVKNINSDRIEVYDLDNKYPFFVSGKDLIESATSADQFAEEEKISKTKMAEILIHCHNRPFTVCFDKTDGTERTLRGRLVAPEPLLGRSTVEDLDVTDGNKLRLVDHRTLKWLIVDGVKFVAK